MKKKKTKGQRPGWTQGGNDIQTILAIWDGNEHQIFLFEVNHARCQGGSHFSSQKTYAAGDLDANPARCEGGMLLSP